MAVVEASFLQLLTELGNTTMITDANDKREAALRLAKLGWNVLPCWTVADGKCICGDADCVSPGKHPCGDLAPHGLRDATDDPKRIEAWWGRHPQANIGVATGPTSGIWVLDLDRKPDGDGVRQFADLDPVGFGYDGIDDTPKQQTGSGGKQVFFRWPGGVNLRNREKIDGNRIDVRGDGGYAIVDPSENGLGAYRWEISPFDVLPAPAADWILALAQKTNSITTSDESLTLTFDGDLATHPGADEGERNNVLCRLVGSHLAAHGIDNELVPLAVAWGARCHPPLDDSQVRRTVIGLAEKHARENRRPSTGITKANVFKLSTVESKSVEWLWKDRFPKKLVIVSGNAGDGKTFALIDLAARKTRGMPFPDGDVPTPGKVMFATVEDGIADTIRPRAEAAGADLDRFLIFDGIKTPEGNNDLLLLDRHIPLLTEVLVDDPEIEWLIIDPIGAFYGDIDSHKDAEIRRVLAPLSKLADELGVCITGIAHMSKNSQRKAIHRTLGSVGIVAAARAAWGVLRDPENHSRRLFLSIKNNLADPTGLAYTITDGRVVWEDQPVRVNIDDIGDLPKTHGACEEACEWLGHVLKDGPVASQALLAAAKKDGIAKRTLERAKKELGVQSKNDCGEWKWFPPTAIVIGGETVNDNSFRF